MSGSANIPIYKMNGLGNQIVVADLRDIEVALNGEHAQQIAANPRTHFDQLMCLYPPRSQASSEAYIEIFNSDGSTAGACGNGMRCVALVTSGRNPRPMSFETAAGVLDVGFSDNGVISVDMGRPRFDWQDIPLRDPFHDTTRIELQVGPIDAPVLHSPSVCNVGNPHAVFWVEDIAAPDLEKFGPLLENHPIFPDRANISVAEIVSRTHARVRTWERGAGLTEACGSGACAVLACASRIDRLGRSAKITVPGGDLAIAWTENDRLIMSGPAEFEYGGSMQIAPDGSIRLEI